MMAQFAHLYPFGQLRYSQSTFLELVTDTEVHRIDFGGKLNFRLQRGTYGPVSFHDEHHPLLNGVQGPSTTLLARPSPHLIANPAALLADIRQELRTQAGEWHDFVRGSWAMWWQRLLAHNIVPNLTRTGGIILENVPIHVAQAVAEICTHHRVETYYHLPTEQQFTHTAPSYKLLLIGRNYVIAQEFFVSTLYGNPSAKLPPRFLKKPR
ncbi:hypothetical protein [Hymenobacter cavernae]|uniref:Uncharacterized protein n=1 Tax=Hymenobacter cavernae TaxID=2044852 RepID=A0ABQ1UIJ2_9BACT|nr:hypothetical protein [Hymenobacter cavernae]GGF18902.1 hypothetical protein GCM10011383_33000 [Hymenobacter cavernae]